jgi:hypothetical protein
MEGNRLELSDILQEVMNGPEFSLQMLDHLGNSQIANTGERTRTWGKIGKAPYTQRNRQFECFNGANVDHIVAQPPMNSPAKCRTRRTKIPC